MIAPLILMSYLASQQWRWDILEEPDVIAYRLYWHSSPKCYIQTEFVEVPALVACSEVNCPPGRCCFEPGEPEGSKYLTITAIDADGLETVDPRRQESCP